MSNHSYECNVCLEQCDGPGIRCLENGHNMCLQSNNDCFSKYLSNNVCPNVFKLKESVCKVPCPCTGVNGACKSWYDDLDVFLNISDMGTRTRYLNTLEFVVDNPGPLEANQLLAREVIGHRDGLLDALTLRCQNASCTMPVDPNPDACAAIMCLSCGVYYCNCCFDSFPATAVGEGDDSSARAHAHVATHHPDYNLETQTGGDAFVPLEVTRRLQLEHQTRCLEAELCRRVDAGVRLRTDRAVKLALICCFRPLVELHRSPAPPGVAEARGAETGEAGKQAAVKTVTIMRGIWSRVMADRSALGTAAAHPSQSSEANIEADQRALSVRVCTQMCNAVRSANPAAVVQLLGALRRESASGPTQKQLLFEAVNYIDKNTGFPLLTFALASGQYPVAAELLGSGADFINVRTVAPNQSVGRSALFVMIEHGLEPLTQTAFVNFFHLICGRQPVPVAAARWTPEEVFCYLVNTPLSCGRYGYCALHVGARYDVAHMIPFLLQCGADINLPESEYGYSPLALALASGNVEVATALVDAGAELCPGVTATAPRSDLHAAAAESRRLRNVSDRTRQAVGDPERPARAPGTCALQILVQHSMTPGYVVAVVVYVNCLSVASVLIVYCFEYLVQILYTVA
jgi:hypothetical protein